MTQLDDLQAFVNLEMPRRPLMLTEAITGETGDPNFVTGKPLVNNAPGGSFFLDSVLKDVYFKEDSGSTSWVLVATGLITGSAALTKSASTLDLFVRDADGDDANDGLSTGAPLKTFAAAVAKLPNAISENTIIHMGSGTYTAIELGQRILSAPFVIWGDGAGGGGDDGFTEVQASAAAAAGTTASQVIDPSFPIADDVFLDFTIEMLTGLAAGQRRTIQEVVGTTGAIIPARAFDSAVTSGDTFRIIRPAVILEGDGAFEFIAGLGPRDEASRGGNPDAPFILANVQMKAATGGVAAGGVFNFLSVHLLLFGVEFFGSGAGGNSLFYFSDCEVMSGLDDIFAGTAEIPAALGLTSAAADWAGWGLTIPVTLLANPHASFFGVGNSSMAGYFNAVNFFTQALSRFGITYNGGRLRGGVSLSGGGLLSMTGGLADDTIDVGTFGFQAGFFMLAGELRSAGPLVDAVGHGRADIFSTASGTSTGDVAIRSRFGARVTLFGAPALVGAVPAVAYEVDDGATGAGTFAAAGDGIVSAAGSGIVRRV